MGPTEGPAAHAREGVLEEGTHGSSQQMEQELQDSALAALTQWH